MKYDIKEIADGLDGGYDDAFIVALLAEVQMYMGRAIWDIMKRNLNGIPVDDIDEDIIDNASMSFTKGDRECVLGVFQSFTFPDRGEWAMSEAQRYIEELEDEKYEVMRDV